MNWRIPVTLALSAFFAAGQPVLTATAELEVLVLDRTTRAPVPQAELRWLTRRELRALPPNADEPTWSLLGREGHAATTDAEGRARLPIPEDNQGLTLSASAGELYGEFARWRHTASRVEIEIAREERANLLVTDSAGEPLEDFPVDVYSEGSKRVRHARTDAQGRASFRQLQATDSWPSRQQDWVVDFPFPTRESHARAIDAAALAGEAILMTPPATGSIRFEVQPERGSPQGWTYTLHVMPRSHAVHRRVIAVDIEDGIGLIEHAEVGLPLKAWGRMASALGIDSIDRVPQLAGERIVVPIRPTRRSITIAGRALRPDGAPLARAELRLSSMRVGQPARHRAQLVTDPEGRFHKQLSPLFDVADFAQLVVSHQDEQGVLQLRVDPVPIDAEQHIELTDRQFKRLPLAAHGRVVDAQGCPLPRARVSLHRSGGGVATSAEATTDQDGRFALYADPAPGEWRVSAERSDRKSSQVVLEGHGQELELLLLRPTRVEGSILVERLPRPDALTVALVDLDGKRTEAKTHVKGDGRFLLVDVSPGAYEVWIELARFGPLRRFPIEIPRAPLVRPESLAQVDLSPFWRSIQLEVVDGDGVPVPSGTLTIRRSTGRSIYVAPLSLTGAPLSLELFEGAVSLEVCAPGHRPWFDDDVDEDRRIVLADPIEVRLWLGGGLEPPAPPLQLVVELRAVDGWRAVGGCARVMGLGQDGHQALAISLEGYVDLRLPAPGRWRVGWHVENRTTGESQHVAGELAEIEVMDSGELQEFDVWPDAELLERAIERVR